MFKLLDTPVGKRFVNEGKLPTMEVELKLNQSTMLDAFVGLLVISIVIVLMVKFIKF